MATNNRKKIQGVVRSAANNVNRPIQGRVVGRVVSGPNGERQVQPITQEFRQQSPAPPIVTQEFRQQSPAPSINTNPAVNPTQTSPSQYSEQISSILNRINTQLNQPQERFNYDPQNDPGYRAAVENARREAGRSANNALVNLGSRGIGNSSIATDRVAQIEQNTTDFIANQLVPQMRDVAYQQYLNDQAQQQQQLTNLANYASMLSGEDQRGLDNAFRQSQFDRGVLESDRAFDRDVLESDRAFERGVLESDRAFERGVLESDRAFDSAEDQRNWQNRFAYGQAIGRFGNNQETLANRQFEADLARDARNFEYQAARDAIADQRYQQEFDENARRWGLEYALNRAVQEGQLDISRMNAATSRMNAETSAGNLGLSRQRFEQDQEQRQLDNLYRQWETTGVAPAGIPGVAQGTPLPQPEQQYQPTSNDITSQYVANLDQMSPENIRKFFENERANIIKDIGPSGYRFLVDTYIQDQDASDRLLRSILD